MSEADRSVLVVVGARPNFMKAGPVLEALRARGAFEPLLVHTGQHYDERMSALFFRDLGLPEPDINLEVGSGTHAQQTAEIMVRFESYVAQLGGRPAAVVVVGDVNSTLACSIVAAKAGIPLAHVEAGLRSFDRTMPEELNRILTDRLADALYVTEASGVENLRNEGTNDDAIALVGNTMIDTLLHHRARAAAARPALLARLGVRERGYGVCTLHRPSNVDEREPLTRVLAAIEQVAAELPILWPAHPRTLARAKSFGLEARIRDLPGVRVIEPQGYLDFLALMDAASLILTDSGGIQEEATVLKVPCVTLRDNTERPITIDMRGNVLVGNDTERIVAGAKRMLALDRESIGAPPLWDGRAGERIAVDLEARLATPTFADARGDA